MRVTKLAEAAMRAWEARDMEALASYLADDFVGRGFLPQPVRKAQYLDFIRAIMMAMPDWSFHDRLLDADPVTEQGERALFITKITGMHTGDLILPDPSRYPTHRHKNIVALQASGVLCQREYHHDAHGRFLTQCSGGDTCADGDGAPVVTCSEGKDGSVTCQSHWL